MGSSSKSIATVMDDIRAAYAGSETVSDWYTVTQEDMDRFALATHDPDWMHIDPERARRDGPFDGTVAFGFWTTSMMTYFARSMRGMEYPEGVAYGLNYGIDRLRLLAPVHIGKRIRMRSRLVELTDKGAGRILMKTENTIDIEGESKPAMIAEWLSMLFVG